MRQFVYLSKDMCEILYNLHNTERDIFVLYWFSLQKWCNRTLPTPYKYPASVG